MDSPGRFLLLLSATGCLAASLPNARAQVPQVPAKIAVGVDWSKTQLTSRSTPTLQVVVNPMLARGAPVHDGATAALRALGADYVRYVPWMPYPRLVVAELEPPTAEKTSWDFAAIDPMTIDFLEATKGHATILNFSTAPQWMFKTPAPVTYPDDPNQVFWKYSQGNELRDPSLKELAGYYARLVGWYANGGFKDENGQEHRSGYHYPIPYWEVFNEIEQEHKLTPPQYTEQYDAIVEAIHAVSPGTKFVGLALTSAKNAAYLEYFLDAKHHRPGIPLDMVSYHFYAAPKPAETPDQWERSFFEQAGVFLERVRKAEEIRQRLSPSTRTTIDELGVILPHDNEPGDPDLRIPPVYWNAAGALYAYLYVELSKLGIDVVGESQLVGYPTQYPSVTMIDWHNAKPNARYWVLKLLKDHFGPGDLLMATTTDGPGDGVTAQGYKTEAGRRLLLINKRNTAQVVGLPKEADGADAEIVDPTTGDDAPRAVKVEGATMTLAPFAVAVVRLES